MSENLPLPPSESHPVRAETPALSGPAASGPASAPPQQPPAAIPAAAASAKRPAWWLLLLIGLAVLAAIAALAVAWNGQQRLQLLEQELVRRQHDSATQAAQARLLADQSQGLAREAVAKATLLETRIAELSLQRSQLDELIRTMSRSRDENVVADIDASVRVALQQTAITGSAAPLVAALKAADERLQRVSEPRLEAARRAIARDLDRIKSASVADIASLSIKIDEAARLVDEMPLLVIDTASPRAGGASSTDATVAAREASAPAAAKGAKPVARAASAAEPVASAASGAGGWMAALSPAVVKSAQEGWRQVVSEIRNLLRVTRIDQPQAMLLAPEQSYFLRENLKLRLLNARLALLSRQFDTAQTDLQSAIAAIDGYFDRSARKTQIASELLRSVAQQARQSAVPRPEDTLSVLAAAAAGR